MITVLAIDPGECSGWAYGRGRNLVACGVCYIDVPGSLPCISADIGVIELPQIYPGPQKADPNDQITLAVNHGRWRDRIRVREFRNPHPKQWKGSVPKKIHQPRIYSALERVEFEIVSKLNLPDTKLHNAIDAVGLFLWTVGRMHGGR